MTVGEALRIKANDGKLKLAEARTVARLLISTWPEPWWAELIPDFTEAPEERIRLALIRPLTKNEDS